jgi:hypothetical protein
MKALAIFSTLLNNYDAGITLYAMNNLGAVEINPIMARLIEMDQALFVGVKNLYLFIVLAIALFFYKDKSRRAVERADLYVFLVLLATCVYNTVLVLCAA